MKAVAVTATKKPRASVRSASGHHTAHRIHLNARAESWCDAPADPAVAALKPAEVQDDWFKVYAVTPGVFAITEPRQYEAVSSFLIVGSERAILFDTGMGIARISDLVRQDHDAARDGAQLAHAFRPRRRQPRVRRRAKPRHRLQQGERPRRGLGRASRVRQPFARGRPGMRGAARRRHEPHLHHCRPGASRPTSATASISNSGAGRWKCCRRRATRPIRSACSTPRTACCSPETPSIRARSISGRRKRT